MSTETGETVTNWKVAQAEHHSRKARLLISFAAAFEGEASMTEDPGRRSYFIRRARTLRKEAAERSSKAAELAPTA